MPNKSFEQTCANNRAGRSIQTLGQPMKRKMPFIYVLLILATFSSSASAAKGPNGEGVPRIIVTAELGNLKRLRLVESDLSRVQGEYPLDDLKFYRTGNARVAFKLSNNGRVIDPIQGGIYTSEAFYQSAVKVLEKLKLEYIGAGPVNRFVAEVAFRVPPCVPENPWMNIDLQLTICTSPDKNAKLEWGKLTIPTPVSDSTRPAELNCDSPGTTLEINECLSREVKAVDTKLNEVYQHVLREFSKQDLYGHVHYSEAKQNLIEAQRAWIKYREKDCDAVYALAIGASMRGQLALQCNRSRTEQRIRELEQFLDP